MPLLVPLDLFKLAGSGESGEDTFLFYFTFAAFFDAAFFAFTALALAV